MLTKHKTAGQLLCEKMKKDRKSINSWKKNKLKNHRIRKRHKRKYKTDSGVKRLFGDNPMFPPTDYISKRSFELRKDVYNSYK